MRTRIFAIVFLFCMPACFWAQSNSQASLQLLNAVNDNDIQQVVDACNRGADFTKLSKKDIKRLNLDNFYEIYEKIDDANAVIVFSDYYLALQGDNDTVKAIIDNNLAYAYKKKGDYVAAEPLYKEALQLLKRIFGEQHPYYASNLNNLALLYIEMGDYVAAEKNIKAALQICKETTGTQNTEYATSLNTLATIYKDMGNYAAAEPLFKEALKILNEVLGTQHPYYASNLNNLAMLYEDMGDYKSAEACLNDALKIRKAVLGELHPDYATSLGNLAVLYKDMGNYAAAEALLKDVLKVQRKALGAQHPNYASNLNNLAMLYEDMGDYKSAEACLNDALKIKKQALGGQHPDYAMNLGNLAALYQMTGDYSSTERLSKESLKILREGVGEQHPYYVANLNNLALLYHKLGNYEAAESLLKEVLQVNKDVFGEQHYKYFTTLSNLAMLYKDMEEFSKAEALLKEVLQKRRELFGTQHADYVNTLNNLGALYHNANDYAAAEPLLKEALQIGRDVLGEQHADYSKILNNLALLYQDMGYKYLDVAYYKAAEPLLQAALQINKNVFGEQHYSYFLSLNNLAVLYDNLGEYAKAEPLHMANRDLNCKLVKSSFGFMSERQREAFWEKEKWSYENIYPNFVYGYISQKKSIASFAYDNELFMKGLLLNEKQQVRNAVLASGDNTLINIYKQLQQAQEQIVYLQQQPKAKQVGLDSLQALAEQLDKQLVLGCKEYRQSKERWEITWQKVRNSLTNKDVAIEFSSFDNEVDHVCNKKIVALLLRKHSSYPEYIVIGNEEELSVLLSEDAATTYNYNGNGAELYKRIWKPLAKHINEGETVYFSPSGLLHQINISALPVSEKETIGEKYRMVQLSSTRELAMQRDRHKCQNAVLYGGLVYNVDEDEMAEASARYQEYGLSYTRSMVETAERAGVKYLSGTKAEIEQIESACKQHAIVTASYTSTRGNEESFKALSRENVDILHVATHGFFFPNEKAKRTKLFMLQDEEQQRERYIDPLMRSGLLLAGANKAWTGHRDQLPEGVQDGILTAKEISLLNLGHTDLVVLSACETGKGEISSDGVFGLQRGFKLAGVNSLMMSLWKVDDKATQMLMTEFYRNMLDGKSKIESLKCAQKHVKSQPVYEDPKYWAGFILLDALN